ncbi:MAG: hypothetical protein MZW92_19600 [Comamonadaceae bacterium]|nr:hypothetical protein [Comamonadaceae bacterium]
MLRLARAWERLRPPLRPWPCRPEPGAGGRSGAARYIPAYVSTPTPAATPPAAPAPTRARPPSRRCGA